MSIKIYATMLLGSVAAITSAAEPQRAGSPDSSTVPGTIDTAGYSVYRFVDSEGKYKTTVRPEVPPVQQQQFNTQTGQQLNGSQETPQTSSSRFSPMGEITSSNMSKPIIQSELKNASIMAKTGATFYGIGFVVEVIGAVVLINDLSSNDYNSSDPPLTGLYVALGGGVTSFIGSIVANCGGSKAKNTLEVVNGDAPPFYGWGYFWGGIACSAAGGLLTSTQVPVLPSVLSIMGFIFDLSSIIHSVGYTNRAYLRSVVLKDLRVSPMVDMRNFKPNGLMISGSF